MLRELVNTNETEVIGLNKIRVDGATQMRAELNEDTLAEYEAIFNSSHAWGPFPPVVLFYDGTDYWIGDGFHRIEALRRSTATHDRDAGQVHAEVRSGTRRDAILYAAGANASHGLRRTTADKHRAIKTLLLDEEWSSWSDNEIARRCNVSPTTVGTVRKQISLSNLDSEKQADPKERMFVRTYTTKHGTQATMKTASIGKAKPEVVDVEQLESVVAGIPNVKASTLRTAAQQRKGHWLYDTAASRAQVAFPDAWNQTRLVNALRNVADQMDRQERQAPRPVSPEQRQYDMAAVSISVPQPPVVKPVGLDALPVVDSDMRFTPSGVPADLAQRGWTLKQVPGSGRYYCHNASGPRATGVFDKIADAVQAAYDMQVDLAWEAAQQPAAPPAVEEDLQTIDKMLNCATATGVLQGMADYWTTLQRLQIEWRRDPNSTGILISLRVQLPDGGWQEWKGSTLAEVIRKADVSL